VQTNASGLSYSTVVTALARQNLDRRASIAAVQHGLL